MNFLSGFTIGAILGIVITALFIWNFRGCQESIVREFSQRDITVIPYSEKQEIVITRKDRETSKLSIINADLADISDDRTLLEELIPGEEATIVATIENTGGVAKEVKIGWFPKRVPKGLLLTQGKIIHELPKNSREEYEITVRAQDSMRAQKVTLNLYLFEKNQRSASNSAPYNFEFMVKRPLSD